MRCQQLITLLLIGLTVSACNSVAPAATSTPTPVSTETTLTPMPKIFPSQEAPQVDLTMYEFPKVVDPDRRYLFYLHGRILEDQGIPAISPDFGEYEYVAILERLASEGFVVISELRPANTDVDSYAGKIVEQINRLLDAGVLADHITVVGASKGGYIAATVSTTLRNTHVNYVLLGTCYPEMVSGWVQNRIPLYGFVLAIYEASDVEYSGSCEDLFTYSKGRGISKHNEIVLHLNMGHGILYKPLDEWILPTVEWANR